MATRSNAWDGIVSKPWISPSGGSIVYHTGEGLAEAYLAAHPSVDTETGEVVEYVGPTTGFNYMALEADIENVGMMGGRAANVSAGRIKESIEVFGPAVTPGTSPRLVELIVVNGHPMTQAMLQRYIKTLKGRVFGAVRTARKVSAFSSSQGEVDEG